MVHSEIDRAARILAVVEDCLRRRTHGESLSDASVEARHPDLMPELGTQLRVAGLVNLARKTFDESPDAESVADTALTPARSQMELESVSCGDTPSSTPSLPTHIRCPQCQEAVSIETVTSWEKITCAACGSTFSVIDNKDDELLGLRAGQKIARFILLEFIGQGAFGTVWKGRDPHLDRIVAIKIPRRGELTGAEAELFLREARATAQIRHPHIVAIHEVGRDGDRIYLVSDFVQGKPLSDHLRINRLTVPAAVKLCETVARSLGYVHRAGVVHRDLKPANILLDERGEPRLTDFGLARRASGDATLTTAGHVVGTPAYMSPEQARGESHDVDARSDIFSLGVILFELITGELPFRGSSRMIVEQVIHEEAPRPRRLNHLVSRDLETICLKCLEKESARRFSSADDLADELGRLMRQEPIRSRPVPPWVRAARWCWRKPLHAALLTLLTMLAVIGPLVAVRQMRLVHRASIATSAAEASATRAGKLAEQEATASRSQREANRRMARVLYASHMNETKAALDNDDRLRAEELLLSHLPDSGGEDLRSFEWYYLWKECHPGLLATIPLPDFPSAAALTPDGRTLVVTFVKSWALLDLETKVSRVMEKQNGIIHNNCIAVSADSSSVAFGDDATPFPISIWNLPAGKLRCTFPGHNGRVLDLAFSPDGRYLASGSQDGTIRLWDAVTGELIETLVERGTLDNACVAFISNGETLVTTTDQRIGEENRWHTTVEVWDVPSRKLKTELKLVGNQCRDIAIGPDDKTLALGKSEIALFDLETLESKEVLPRSPGGVTHIAFSPCPPLIAGFDLLRNGICCWNLETLQITHRLTPHSQVQYAAFREDGQSLVTVGADKTVRIWDSASPSKSAAQSETARLSESYGVSRMHFSPDGQRLICEYFGDFATAWNLSSRRKERVFAKTTRGTSLSPDGTRMAAAHEDSIRIYAVDRGECERMLTGYSDPAWQVVYSPSGDRLASLHGYRDHTRNRGTLVDALIWDTQTWEPVVRLPGHNRFVDVLAFSQDGTRVATFADELRCWDAKTGQLIWSATPISGGCNRLFFNLDGGRLLALAAELNKFFVLNAHNGDIVREIVCGTIKSRDAALSPDGKTLVVGLGVTTNHVSRAGEIQLWDYETGELKLTLGRGIGPVNSIAFMPDGLTLASSHTQGGGIHFWRAASPEEVRRTLPIATSMKSATK